MIRAFAPTLMRDRQRFVAAASYVVLLASLVGLIAAMLVSLRDTRRLFDSAAEAQRQIALVSRIQSLTGTNPIDRPALDAALAGYRGSIAVEERTLGPASHAHQTSELGDADRLAVLSETRAGQTSLAGLVGAIAAREQQEAADLAQQMAALRQRVSWLVALLALTATLSGGLGAAGLLAANRRLTALVTARTATLAAVDRSRRLFFAKASHELRTPVTVMRGEAEVALAGPSDPAALREALGHVVAHAAFLDHRIEELLGLARADNGQIALHMEELDLGSMLAQASDAARAYAGSVDVAIVPPPRDGAPLIVRGDRRWLGQAVLAVLENGVKFSPGGGTVALAITRAADSARIAITDRGIGVAEGALPRIFDAYYQTEAGQARGGTGLGLALARWVVEQHGGTIAAHNNDGGGCTIAIDLPVAA